MKWTREAAGQWTSDAGYTADLTKHRWTLMLNGQVIGTYASLKVCKEIAADHAGNAEGEECADFTASPTPTPTSPTAPVPTAAGMSATATTSSPDTPPTAPGTEPARLKHSMFPGFRARRGKRLEDVVAAWVWAAGCFLYGMTT